MNNISLKLNLALLRAVRRTEKGTSGPVECLIIPIKANALFEGKDGALYLDLIAFELKEKKEGRSDTHLIKQSFPTDVYKAMTDEQKKATPILGNLTVWQEDENPLMQKDSKAAPVIKPQDDLPF
jgi:hypothetical protein